MNNFLGEDIFLLDEKIYIDSYIDFNEKEIIVNKYYKKVNKKNFSNTTKMRKSLYKNYAWYGDFSTETVVANQNHKKRDEKRLLNYKKFIDEIRKRKYNLN